jgi:hypothetical protein
MTTRSKPRLRVISTAVAALVATAQLARADDRLPAFEALFPQPSMAAAVNAPIGQRYVTGAGNGLYAMADMACRVEKRLDTLKFSELAKRLILRVAAARDRARLTGLDATAANAAYQLEMGPERLRRLAEFQSKTDAVSKAYRDAAAETILASLVPEQLDLMMTGFIAAQYRHSDKFSAGAFDAWPSLNTMMSVRDKHDAALKALSAEARNDITAHNRASNVAWTKATDFKIAVRLGSRDVIELIADELAAHCIAKPSG